MPDIELENEQDKALEVGTKNEISPSAILAKEGNDLTNQIIGETDTSKLNDLTKLFELNRKKKDIVRANKLSNLLTMIDDEIVTRISTTPDLIKDQDLVKYMQSAQEAISVGSEAGTQITQINITNNTDVNVANTPQLSRESRQRVLSAVQEILSNIDTQTDIVDVQVEKKEEEQCEKT